MITTVKGNMLLANADALVNTVNTVGVMGKGIALQFRERFPENFKHYQQVCKRGELQPGGLLVFREKTLHGERIIINFATKKEWFRKSQYAWIESGLDALAGVIRDWNIGSIALPPLGCGNGGLDWNRVKPMIVGHLGNIPNLNVLMYEPDETVLEILKKQDAAKDIRLTSARAMLLYALFQREAFGEEASLFAANKLAYFLQQFGEKQLKLNFVRHFYGPYSNQVDHLMYALNGKFLRGLEQKNAKAFEPLQLNYEAYPEVKSYFDSKLSPSERAHLDRTLEFLDGFQSPLALEALASTHSILLENPRQTEQEVFEKIKTWSSRKRMLFTPQQIGIAWQRLHQYQDDLLPES